MTRANVGRRRRLPSAVPLRRDREFLALVAGRGISSFGDQVARVAVAVLIFSGTGSPAQTAAGLAVSYLPWVLVAPFIAGLGDRFPRRRVLVASDAYRCVLALALALPHLRTPAVIGLVFMLTCGDPPFEAARAALLPDVLSERRYVSGQGASQTSNAAASFAGYAVGGLLVAAVGSHTALVLDAATFAVSGLLLGGLLRRRPAAVPDATTARSRSGWSLVLGNPVARWCLSYGAVLLALDTVSIGLVVPWAAELGHGASLAGLLAASGVLGGALGQFALTRVGDGDRQRLLTPLALLSMALFVPLLGVRSPVPSLVLLFISGVCTAYQTVVNQLFVLAIPAGARSRAFGVAGTVINLGQGAAILVAGFLANHLLPSTVIGCSGILGLGAVASLRLLRPALPSVPEARHAQRVLLTRSGEI